MACVDSVKEIRRKTCGPVWAIKMCLELYNGNEEMAIKRLYSIYDVIGDNPMDVIKMRENKLRSEYASTIRSTVRIMRENYKENNYE